MAGGPALVLTGSRTNTLRDQSPRLVGHGPRSASQSHRPPPPPLHQLPSASASPLLPITVLLLHKPSVPVVPGRTFESSLAQISKSCQAQVKDPRFQVDLLRPCQFSKPRSTHACGARVPTPIPDRCVAHKFYVQFRFQAAQRTGQGIRRAPRWWRHPVIHCHHEEPAIPPLPRRGERMAMSGPLSDEGIHTAEKEGLFSFFQGSADPEDPEARRVRQPVEGTPSIPGSWRGLVSACIGSRRGESGGGVQFHHSTAIHQLGPSSLRRGSHP